MTLFGVPSYILVVTVFLLLAQFGNTGALDVATGGAPVQASGERQMIREAK
jgi:hypothetical protein